MTLTATHAESFTPPRTARVATAAIFWLNGVVFGVWVARIPDVQHALGLQNLELGVTLLGPAAGSLLGMQVVPHAIARFGTRPVVTAVAAGTTLTLPLLALAGGLWQLAALLLLFGVVFGSLDVAMNAHAVAVERGYRREIMSSFHGWFSLGGLVGAAGGGIAASAGLDVRTTFLVAAVLMLLVALAAGAGLGRLVPGTRRAGRGAAAPAEAVGATARPDGESPVPDPAVGPPRRAGGRHRAAVLLLGAMAFVGLMAEGSVGDWSGVYLRNDRGAEHGMAALGFVGFSVAMTIGRFAGDRGRARWGSVGSVRRGAGLAAVGLVAGLASPWVAGVVTGFALMGAGLSVIVPVLFSEAAVLPGQAPGKAIARVSTLGYLGFLAGPPMIGGLADLVGLGWALAAPAVLLLLVTATAGWASARQVPATDPV